MPAAAQTMNDAPMPVRYVLDENGVNLADGLHYGSETVIASIGSGENALTIRARDGASYFGLNSYAGNISVSGSIYTATVPGSRLTKTYKFSKSGSTYTSLSGDGATMTQSTAGLCADHRRGHLIHLRFPGSLIRSAVAGGATDEGTVRQRQHSDDGLAGHHILHQLLR